MPLPARTALAALWLTCAGHAAAAHGVQISADLTQAVQIRATYDTGQPMAQAQVSVFAPANPLEIWARGVTDDRGVFTFVPDPAQPGQYTAQVRQAGHGAIVSITTGAATPPTQARTAPQTTGQKLLMVALVAWGALGTALFFWRRKASAHASA